MFSVDHSFNNDIGTTSNGDLGYNGFPVSLNYFTALPDPSSLHNPNLTIIFKSLLKKDSITKEKSLNDFILLLTDLENCKLVDDLLILSWIQLYAKLAIDNSRSVRILSHQVHAKIFELTGGKAFSKYLMSSIPIWLQGIYDNDRLVSGSTYKTLLQSFQNNKERVDSKVWIMFSEQIINYVATVSNSETHKSLSDQRYTKEADSIAKYERVLNGSILMLTKIISLINTNEIKIKNVDNELEQIDRLLNLETLWDYLGSSISMDSLNLPLFKSLLILIRSIFGNVSTSSNNDTNIITSNLPNIKAIYKLVSKKFIKHVKLKPSKKGTNNDIIFSNVILQFWDTIISLTGFSLLIPSDKRTLKIKKNFWELGGNKSRSRLVDYLKLGGCLLNSIFYVVLGQFFQTLSNASVRKDESDNDEVILFNDTSDAKLIISDILCSQLESLSDVEHEEKCLDCILKVYGLFNERITEGNDELLTILRYVLYQVLDTSSKSRNGSLTNYESLIIQVGGYLKHNISEKMIELLLTEINYQVLYCSTSDEDTKLTLSEYDINSSSLGIITNYFTLLVHLRDELPLANNLLNQLISDICKSVEEEKLMIEPRNALCIIIMYLRSSFVKSDKINEDVRRLVSDVPSFIESLFIDIPIEVLNYFLDSSIFNKENFDLKELINDFYLKISTTDRSKIPLLLSIISTELELPSIKTEFADIYQYLLELSERNNLTEEEASIVFSYTKDQNIFENLISAFNIDIDNLVKFIDYFLKYSSMGMPRDQDSQSFVKLDHILLTCWENIEKDNSQEFLKSFAETSSLQHFKDSIFHFITSSSVEKDFSSILKFLVNLSGPEGSVFKFLPVKRLYYLVSEVVDRIDNNLLAIANPLEQNIFLISSTSNEKSCLNLSLLSVGKFLSELADYLSTSEDEEAIDLLIASGIIAEYIHDYSFLQNADKRLNIIDEQILLVRIKLLDILKNYLKGLNLSSIVPIINDENVENTINDFGIRMIVRLDNELTEKRDYDNFQFYIGRLMKLFLDNLVEMETIQSFESNIAINFNKLLSHPLKFSVIISSLSNFFFKSNKFERIRNYIAAEILGVKSDTQILDEGLKWLTLVINFFNVDRSDIGNNEVIPSHRLAMILNQLSKWLESDISYDESFIKIRCQMARFLSGLLHSGNENLPDKFWNLAIHLCLDNLGIALTEPAHLELQYFTLKLFISMTKACEYHNDDWEENKDSLHEEILDLLTNDENNSQYLSFNNQPVYLCHDLLKRICNNYKFSDRLLNDKINNLYDLLSKSRFVELQRIGASLLHGLILSNQQEFVIEHQLQKSNINSSENLDGENAKLDAKLPPQLIEAISGVNPEFADLIDFEESHVVSKALWGWYLIFDHFKDITYSIRSEYVNQLKSDGLIDKLLNLVFELVDVSNYNEILKKLTTDENKGGKIKPSDNLIKDYDIEEGIVGELHKFEMKFLLIHLYYLSFQYLGSYVQSWFNSIRDRQLKQRIEKFSIKYVSPLIVYKILEDVSKTKDKLISKDENMSIKVSNTTNEIRSIYSIDDQTMEMVIKIPESYPLSNVSVEGPLRLGVKENQWKAWLLASQRIISLTNGSIIESIELFSRNVNLHFAGFEDCAICYSILHQDHSLPSKTCPTCLNKFHAACLYKWFKSSGASTCPLCRSAFNFRSSKLN